MLIAVGVAIAVYFLPIKGPLLSAAEWARAHPSMAWPVFILAYIAAVILMIPAWALMMSGGYLFGTWAGIAVVVVANLLGSVITFWMGRTVARRWVIRRVRKAPRFRSLDRATRRNGLLMVTMSRLALVPYNLLNYACGLTGVRLRDYAAGTLVGSMPLIVLNIVIGSRATDIASLVRGEMESSSQEKLFLVISLLGVGGVIFVITRMASKALKRRLNET